MRSCGRERRWQAAWRRSQRTTRRRRGGGELSSAARRIVAAAEVNAAVHSCHPHTNRTRRGHHRAGRTHGTKVAETTAGRPDNTPAGGGRRVLRHPPPDTVHSTLTCSVRQQLVRDYGFSQQRGPAGTHGDKVRGGVGRIWQVSQNLGSRERSEGDLSGVECIRKEIHPECPWRRRVWFGNGVCFQTAAPWAAEPLWVSSAALHTRRRLRVVGVTGCGFLLFLFWAGRRPRWWRGEWGPGHRAATSPPRRRRCAATGSSRWWRTRRRSSWTPAPTAPSTPGARAVCLTASRSVTAATSATTGAT